MDNRIKITGVTINVEMPNGQSKIITIDPTRVEAIFWTDRAVNEILAPFYDKIDKKVSKETIIERFGEQAEQLMKNFDNEFRITPDFITQLWELNNQSENKTAFITKTRKCIPTPGGDPR